MTKKSTYLLGIVLTICIGAILNWWFCCKYSTYDTKLTENSTVATPVPEEKTIIPLLIKDPQGDFDYSTDDNINFKNSSKEILEPISLKVDTGILKLTTYVNSHPEKNVDITGYYTSNEVYNGSFPDLGIARATAVKNHLISKGLTSKQINVFSALKARIAEEDSVLIGPIKFAIQTMDTTAVGSADNAIAAELKVLEATIKENPLILYFKTGQSAIRLNETQRQKIFDISKYLDKVDNAKCLVIGHTDNVGDPNTNTTLGQKRADYARKYLINNGILPQKIEATSKGDRTPIAPNTTAEGRAKNRRTVITIN